jgi:predicted PurR-regulated permease PerM
VLICGKLLGPLGLLVAVPGLAVLLVVVRKLLVERGYGDTATSPEPTPAPTPAP